MNHNIGTIILAGGEGSRLGHNGPKGTLLYKGESLFSHLMNKLPHPTPPVLILTSTRNHVATKDHFEEHGWFKHNPLAIQFVKQPDLHYLNKEGKALDIQGPNGNGGLLDVFNPEPWRQLGVEHVIIIPVDNPLADPYDRELVAFQIETGSEIVFRAFKRKDPFEKVGASNGFTIVDYQSEDLSDLTLYPFGNMNLFSCSLSFLARKPELPIHWVAKKTPTGIDAFKGEKFITDLTGLARRSQALICSREAWFSPIKTAADLLQL